MKRTTLLSLAALGLTAFVGLPSQAQAACDPALVAATRAAAFEGGKIPAAAGRLGFRESYRFADCVGPPAIRILLRQHDNGQIVLSSQLLDAFRFKAPNVLNRRRSD